MAYRLMRVDGEIDRLIEQCFDAENDGSKYPGMSYEEGIRATIDWLLDTGRDSDHPLDD